MQLNSCLKVLKPFIVVFFLTGCTRSYYFLNALNGNNNYYHALPLKTDSIRSACYFSSVISWGGGNYLDDGVKSITANLHRSYYFGSFQGYYGTDFSFGSYHVSNDYSSRYNNRTQGQVEAFNKFAGYKYFGGYGINGGIDFVIPKKSGGGEWRILGIETSMQNEFGKYFHFRNIVPDSLVGESMRSRFLPTIGINSEVVLRIGKGSSTGYKIALGTSIKKEDINKLGLSNILTDHSNNPFYFTQTFYVTNKAWTIFGQLTFATYSAFIQAGFNYKLKQKDKHSQ